MTSAFCGWIGQASINQPPRDVLDRMAACLPPSGAGSHASYVGENFAVSGNLPSQNVLIDDAIYAFISGAPHWRSPGLAELASRQGHAAALKEAYTQRGPNLLEDLHGAFAVALLDRQTNSILLAIDRMGIQPLCYTSPDGHSIVFASTATAVRVHPACNTQVDPQSILHYLYFHVVPSPGTVFKNVSKLLPAEQLHHRAGKLQRSFYWQPRFLDQSNEPKATLATRLHTLLRDATRRCIPSTNVGCFLSGGVDSSTIAGVLAELQPGHTRTFSIGFDAVGYDEMEYARITARHFGTEHHEYYVTPQDVVTAVPRIADTYDEPFGNSSAIPVYYCARLAQQHGVQTLLAGDGGDEIFGGNVRYAKQKIFEIYHRLPDSLRRHLIEPILRPATPTSAMPLVRKAHSYVQQARVPMPDRLETYNFLYRTPFREMLHPDFLGAVDTSAPLRLLRETYAHAPSKSLVNRMLYLDWKQTLADNDLRKVNGMSQLAGTMVCYPLLDDSIVELSTEVPAHLKVRGSRLRYFFKWAMRDFLPPAVLTKSKHGFGLPFGVWMRSYTPLRDLAYDSLTALKKRRYLNSVYIDRLIELHRDEHAAYYGEFIWVLMQLELWLAAHDRPA